jgi:hypothetical protein
VGESGGSGFWLVMMIMMVVVEFPRSNFLRVFFSTPLFSPGHELFEVREVVTPPALYRVLE